MPAIVSILHRISGVFLFLLIPVLLLLLDISMSWQGFELLKDLFQSFFFKTVVWLFLIPFLFHLVAGIRHLLMDIHLGTSLQGGRIGSIIVFIVSALLIVLAGVWLW